MPFDSTTQTFAAGPQLNYRHISHVTLFIRPSIGAIHENVTVRNLDPITAQIVAQLAPSGKKSDWTGFYGFGGGVDISPSDHFGLRLQMDFVHDHLFNDLLRGGAQLHSHLHRTDHSLRQERDQISDRDMRVPVPQERSGLCFCARRTL